jgi:hypothetical protein
MFYYIFIYVFRKFSRKYFFVTFFVTYFCRKLESLQNVLKKNYLEYFHRKSKKTIHKINLYILEIEISIRAYVRT